MEDDSKIWIVVLILCIGILCTLFFIFNSDKINLNSSLNNSVHKNILINNSSQQIEIKNNSIIVNEKKVEINISNVSKVINKTSLNETKNEVAPLIKEIQIEKMEKGYGVWIYGTFNETEYLKYVDEINNYNNLQSDDSKKIKYLFVWAGYVSIQNGQWNFKYNNTRVEFFHREMPNAKVYAMIDSQKDYVNQMNNSNAEEIAEKIYSQIEDDPNIEGVHFDFEPESNFTEKVAEILKQKTSKKVSVALSHYDADFLNKIDFSVLMNYCQYKNDTFDKFYSASLSRLNRYYSLCVNNSANCMDGILIAPTSCEVDNITQYTNLSLIVYDNILNKYGDKNMVGVSLYMLQYQYNVTLNSETVDLLREN